MSPSQAPHEPAPILLVSPEPDDHFRLVQILNHPHWQWHRSEGCRQAKDVLNNHAVTVMICGRDQTDGCWRDLIDPAAKLTAPPNLIVCSRLVDDSLWAEVVNFGGYDVLVKPFDHEEVLRVGFLAWHSWKRRSGIGSVNPV